jgi:hypothetical protein
MVYRFLMVWDEFQARRYRNDPWRRPPTLMSAVAEWKCLRKNGRLRKGFVSRIVQSVCQHCDLQIPAITSQLLLHHRCISLASMKTLTGLAQTLSSELQTKYASPAFAISSSSTPSQFGHRISPGVNCPFVQSPTNNAPLCWVLVTITFSI